MLLSSDLINHFRYLFVGGLHRSGTSLAARLIGGLPGVAQIAGAPVPEQEGAYLQGAILHDALSGRPMHFATDPAQHLTEDHPLNRLETRVRLEADWAPWFGPGAWRVEKSPVNLTRMRLLQQLYPLAQFVVVIRHPEAVAAAVAKWVDDPPARLMDHWLDAHDRMLSDIERIHAVLVLRYEDLTELTEAYIDGLAAFLTLDGGTSMAREVVVNRNSQYSGDTILNTKQATRAADWGYGPALSVDRDWSSIVRHPLRDIRDATAMQFERTHIN